MIQNPYLSERALNHIFQVIVNEVNRGQSQVCMRTIGLRAGYSLRTAQYSIPELARRGKIIIEKGKPGQPFRYRLPT